MNTFVQNLESRTLFAATAVLDSSTSSLNITGTSSNDAIYLSKSGTNVVVSLNGVNKTFALSKIIAINAKLGAGNDTFKMTDSVVKAAYIEGGDGNDLLVGGGQNDYITGGNNNDTVDGGAGNDILHGDAGTDTADFSNRTYALKITLDDIANDGAASGGSDNVYTDVENVLGGSAGDKIYGSSKSNKLTGNGGNDTIYGNGGNDSIYGNSGNDSLIGNTGNDKAYGGSGNDWIDITDGVLANDYADGGSDNDTCYRDKGTSSKDTTINCEVLFG